MMIREGRETDASVIRAFAAGDIDPAFLLRERTVRVALPDGSTENEDDESRESSAITGFLAFEARTDAVHVTRIGGEDAAVDALLDDVVAFATREGLPVEAVVPTDGSAAVALETKGFEGDGRGPRFEGRETTRYRRSQLTEDTGGDGAA